MNTFRIPAPLNQNTIMAKNFHQDGEDRAIEIINSFSEALIMQAKIEAYKNNDAIVLSRHVDDAFNITMNQKRTNKLKEASKIASGALLGFSLPSIFNAYNVDNINGVVLYGIIFVFGILFLLYGTS